MARRFVSYDEIDNALNDILNHREDLKNIRYYINLVFHVLYDKCNKEFIDYTIISSYGMTMVRPGFYHSQTDAFIAYIHGIELPKYDGEQIYKFQIDISDCLGSVNSLAPCMYIRINLKTSHMTVDRGSVPLCEFRFGSISV